METIVKRCAGLDIHKKSIMVCVLIVAASGKVEKFVREFGTMTCDLLSLSDWLEESEVTNVAMESTGVYWKPVYNILEDRFKVLLCNARHIKQVPGRKSDVKDCEWIAQLLQHGLLRGSYIPSRAQRDLRDLTRHRSQLVSEKTRVSNRIEKILEDANVKLASVASETLGVSGREMIYALISGEQDSTKLAVLARRRLRAKIPELIKALEGRVTEHHRFMLGKLMRHLNFLEEEIEELELRIERLVFSQELSPKDPENRTGADNCEKTDKNSEVKESVPPPYTFSKAASELSQIPGIEQISAQAILAETGTDMSQFPSDKHFSSWARLCPGNNESAGKHKSTKTGKANRWLRSVLTQCAWAAARSKDTYFSSQYKQIAKRRGKKRAIVAVSHTMLTILYHMLKYHRAYVDLGGDYFDKINPKKKQHYHIKRLEELGLKVTVEPLSVAA